MRVNTRTLWESFLTQGFRTTPRGSVAPRPLLPQKRLQIQWPPVFFCIAVAGQHTARNNQQPSKNSPDPIHTLSAPHFPHSAVLMDESAASVLLYCGTKQHIHFDRYYACGQSNFEVGLCFNKIRAPSKNARVYMQWATNPTNHSDLLSGRRMELPTHLG